MLTIVLGIFSLFSWIDSSAKHNVYPLPDTVRLSPKARLVAPDTAKYLVVNRIFIIGNKITRDPIILRELSLKQGDVVLADELLLILDRDKKKLFNTHLFNTADVKPLELEPGIIDLLVEVNERWYTFPSPRFELSDRNLNEWWENYNHDFDRVIYGLKLYQYNMRGRNETLLLTALFGFQRNFSINYRIPYIDKKQKQGLAVGFEFSEAKNLAARTVDHKLDFIKVRDILMVSRVASIAYTYRNSFYDTHIIEAEYTSRSVSDTVTRLNFNYFGNLRKEQRYTALTYKFSSDHRDVVAYPLKGYQLIFYALKTGLGFGDDINKFEVNLSYARYKDLKNGFYISNYSNVSWSDPTSLPYSNYNALGNKRQFVKGYEIYVIEGPYSILNKTTLKKRILARNYTWRLLPKEFEYIPLSIYTKLHGDLGYVKNYPYYEANNLNTKLSNTLLAGIGGGLDIVASYDLVIRLEYTFNIQGKNGFYLHLKKEF